MKNEVAKRRGVANQSLIGSSAVLAWRHLYLKTRITNISNPATANASSSPSHFYDYDTVGNRDSVLAFGATTNYVSNTVNAYSAVSGFAAPIHDANGNMTSGPIDALTAQLVYDKENRLRSSTRNGVTSTFTYDALGRLLTVDRHQNLKAVVLQINPIL